MASTLGMHRATVVSTQDPAGKGRLRLRLPQLFGETPTDWVEPTIPGGLVPAPGSAVWVAFQGGDAARPVYISGSPATDLSGYVQTSDSRLTDVRFPSNDAALMHLAGTETVTGDKNFTGTLTKGGVAVVLTDDTRLATGEDAKVLALMGVL